MTNNGSGPLVKDVMSRSVVTADCGDTIHEVLDLMVQNRVSAIPIVDRKGQCAGMLSTSDLIDLTRDLDEDLYRLEESAGAARTWIINSLSSAMGHERVDSVMSDRVASIDAHAPVQAAAQQMLKNRVHRLPVTNEADRVVGIVSTMDLLRVLVHDGEI